MKLIKAVAGAALLSLSTMAAALPISGSISFSSIPDAPFSFDTATNTFDFADGPNAQVDNVAGDFASYFQAEELVQFFDFNYNEPFSPQLIWSGNGISFYLTELVRPAAEGSTFVGLEGYGILTDGTNSVEGFWNITANVTGKGSNATFSWSSGTSVVPEPTTLALMGLGMLGFGLSRRKSA